MTPKPTGRPTVMTKATVLKLEAALRDGFSVETACHLSGISRSAYYAHLERNPDFAHNMELSKQWTIERAKQVVAQAVAAGDIKICQWVLERRCRAEYATNPPAQPQQNNLNGWIDGGEREEKLFNLLSSAQANLPRRKAIAEA